MLIAIVVDTISGSGNPTSGTISAPPPVVEPSATANGVADPGTISALPSVVKPSAAAHALGDLLTDVLSNPFGDLSWDSFLVDFAPPANFSISPPAGIFLLGLDATGNASGDLSRDAFSQNPAPPPADLSAPPSADLFALG